MLLGGGDDRGIQRVQDEPGRLRCHQAGNVGVLLGGVGDLQGGVDHAGAGIPVGGRPQAVAGTHHHRRFTCRLIARGNREERH